MPRKCSICTHAACESVNSEIRSGKSFRAISSQILGSEKQREAVRRHSENCLKLDAKALFEEKKIKRAVDHYQEITDQLEFGKDLREASRAYLTDAESGKIVLFPRADEVTVVYEDYSDTTPNGDPKKKRDTLANLLERAEAANVQAVQTIIKHVDIRSFALTAIQTVDVVLDKIAKLEGLYTKERENEQKMERTVKAVLSWLEDYPEDREKLDEIIKEFAQGRTVSADEVKEKVIQELGNVG